MNGSSSVLPHTRFLVCIILCVHCHSFFGIMFAVSLVTSFYPYLVHAAICMHACMYCCLVSTWTLLSSSLYQNHCTAVNRMRLSRLTLGGALHLSPGAGGAVRETMDADGGHGVGGTNNSRPNPDRLMSAL